jgi:hypothetical protein
MGVMIRLPVAANRSLTTETDFMFPGQIQTFNTGLQGCTTRLGTKPNRNEQGSHVVRQWCAAFASVGCMELGVVRLQVKKTEIIGTVRAQKRRSRQ